MESMKLVESICIWRFQMSAMLLCLLCVSLAAPPALAAAAPPPPLPPPPPPPPPPPGPPAVPVLAPPGACESLGPCELFAELQEHSRRIAGFSYNVKKADAALTTLARQQAAAADRAQRLADTIRQLETGLEAAANGEGGNSTDGAGGGGGGGGGTGLLMVAAPVAATAAPDWEKAASREMARLGDRLSRLREQVNTSFVPTLRENGEELGVLRGRVASLHVQVADLEAAVRGETVGRRVSAAGGGDDDGPSQSPRGTSAAPPTSTPTAPPATPDSSSSESQEVEIQTQTAVGVAEAATEAVAEGTTVGWEGMADLEEGGERGGGNVTEEATSTTASIAAPSSIPDAEEEVIGSTAVTEAPTALVVQTDGEGSGSVNGNGNGNGNGESVDLLGIELETVRGAFETLHAQVTELQTRCVTRGDELEALVTSLEERLAKLEASRLPSSETASQSAAENSTEATLIGNETSSSPAPDLQFPVEPITLQTSPTQLFTFGSEHHQDELPTVETTNVSNSTTQASEPATSETGVQ